MTDHKQDSEQIPPVPQAGAPVPSNAQQPFAGQPFQPGQSYPQQPPVSHSQELDLFGLLSVIFILIMPFIGLILGIVGLVQCKKKQLPNTLSLVGVILNSIFTLIGFLYIAFIVIMLVLGASAGS